MPRAEVPFVGGAYWDPDVNVHIERTGLASARVAVHFGEWPGIVHNTWFMNESDLDILIMKLLDAKVRYKDGQST